MVGHFWHAAYTLLRTGGIGRAVSTRRTNVRRRQAWSSSSAENPDYPYVVVPVLSELTIWGLVTRYLHHV
jgi:hypothetical protein